MVRLAPDEAAVTCIVKNGAFYIEQFIQHYFNLGFKHICFMDNGSADDTVDLARSDSRITMYRCTLPIAGQQGRMKRHLAELAVPAGWCLDVDIDEFFVYPYAEILPFRRFVAYLNANTYTAVLTQMLDMFSDQPLSFLATNRYEPLSIVHRYFDISNVTKVNYYRDSLAGAYGSRNQVADKNTAIYWGGVRKTIYGIGCCLTKHSFFKNGTDVTLFPHVHFVNDARLADVSCALLHYKFAGNAFDDAAQNKTAFVANSDGYERIIATINRNPHLRIISKTAQAYRSSQELLDNGFLFASPAFRSYARLSS